MASGHDGIRHHVTRRTLLVAGGLGFCGLDATRLARGETPARPAGSGGKARSTILIWLSGGASHVDTWDLKPDAPSGFRSEFGAIETSAPGIRLCEHLPHLSKQAHHLAIVRSLGHFGRGTGDHHAGYYYNLTGRAPDPTFKALLNARTPYATDFPFIGSVVASQRPTHPYLPQLVTLPQKPGAPEYTRPGQFAARLGVEHDPIYVLGSREKPLEFAVPALSLEGNVSGSRLLSRKELLGTVDQACRDFDGTTLSHDYTTHQQRAFSLLASSASKQAFDLSKEPESVRAKYGATVNAMSLLLARRLVEAGVPFVSVFWLEDPELNTLCKSGGGWDTHGNNFNCLKTRLLPEFDRPFAALLDDLHGRGMLDSTLVMVNSEMGRNPRIGDVRSGGVRGAGRDHWTNCMSVLLAGGGIRGGQAYGTSDKVGAYPAEHPVAPDDIARTVYHAMGVTELQASDREGRPFDLLPPDGRPLLPLFS